MYIFRFCISHHTAAKTDHTAVDVHDRKHDTIPELIIYSVFLIGTDQSRLTDQVFRIPFGAKIPIQIVTVFVGITKPERFDRLIGKFSLFQILISDPPLF